MTITRPRIIHLLDSEEMRVNPDSQGVRSEYLPDGLDLDNWFSRSPAGHDLAEHFFLNSRINAGTSRSAGVLIEVVHPRGLQEFWKEIRNQYAELDGLCMVVDEEGLLYGLPLNPPASVLYGYGLHPGVTTPITGPAFILGEKRVYDDEGYLEDTKLVGLPPELTEATFVQLFKSIMVASTTATAIKLDPSVLMGD